MSISFYIQNRKGLFSYKAVETPLSLVSLVEGLEVVGLEEIRLINPWIRSELFWLSIGKEQAVGLKFIICQTGKPTRFAS